MNRPSRQSVGALAACLLGAGVLVLSACAPVQRKDDAFKLPWLTGRQTAYGTITTLSTQRCENETHRPYGVTWKSLSCDIFVSDRFEYLGEEGDLALFFAQDGSYVGGMFRTARVTQEFRTAVEERFGRTQPASASCDRLRASLVRCEAVARDKTLVLLTEDSERQALTLWYADALPAEAKRQLCDAFGLALCKGTGRAAP